jgi:hypothetical protein
MQSLHTGLKGAGFGIGAMEEDDDEDVYDMPSLDRYDVKVQEEDTTKLKGDSHKRFKAGEKVIKNVREMHVEKMCRDGLAPLRGYIVAKVTERLTKW